MKIQRENTVAEIVTRNIKTADVFKKHGIDFCCGGGVSLEKVCTKKALDYEALRKELLQVDAIETHSNDYTQWELSFLVDYIVQEHHAYVTESIVLIYEYVTKVAKVHGHHYKELLEIQNTFLEVARELTFHMEKEEKVLFPYIKKLEQAKKEGKQIEAPIFKTVSNPIEAMEIEHENTGTLFKKIAVLSNNYTPPENACNTFRALYAKLREFEENLHQHIHLENNIVHPRAKKLEAQFV